MPLELLLLLLFVGGIRAVMTTPLDFPRYAIAGAAAGGKIVFAGGNDTTWSNHVDIYDANTKQKYNASLSVARMDLAGAGADNTIIFAGGSGGTGVLAAVDIYNTVSDTWTVANLSLGRSVLCGAGLGTKIVFAGGGRVVAVNNVDVYDTQLTKWTTSSLSVARYALSCAGAGTKIVFAGGFDGTTAFQNADIYDITSNLWTAQPNALSVGRYVGAAAAAGNKIVFAGGMNAASMPQSAVDIYDVSTGVWTASQYKLSIGRYFLAAVGALDKVFIAGGSNGSGVWSLMDVYDTTLDLWFSSLTGSGSLVLPRFRLAAATTQNYVLFAGGVGPSGSPPVLGPSAVVDLLFSCRGLPPATPAICINGLWIIPNNVTVINVTAGQGVVVNGSIDLPPTSAIVLTTSSTSGTGAAITVNGTANVDGALVLVLLDVPSSGTLVPILNADAVNGSFSTITVKSPPTCATLTATQVIDNSGGLGALISVDSSTCSGKKKGLSNGAIAGIVLGVLIVVIIGGIIGGYFLITRCPQARFLFRSQRLRTRAQTYSHSVTYDA